jgi:hypothetical protein
LCAAEEAERLLMPRKLSSPSSKSEETPHVEALEAANALLKVVSPSSNSSLVKAMKERANSRQQASVHRAFVALTSQCLDGMMRVDEKGQKVTTPSASLLLDRALTLSRRAQGLSLPFHIPLYQRLMEAVVVVSTAQQSPIDPLEYTGFEESTVVLPDTILEVASWVAGSLEDATVDSKLFRPALLELVRQQQYQAAADLFAGMQMRYNIHQLDKPTVQDLIAQMHAALKEALSQQEFRSLDDFALAVAAADLVELLEPHMLSVAEEHLDEKDQEEDMAMEDLSALSHQEMDDVIDNLLEKESRDDSEDDSCQREASFHIANKAKDATKEDLFISSFLTKRVKDERVRSLVRDLITKKGPSELEIHGMQTTIYHEDGSVTSKKWGELPKIPESIIQQELKFIRQFFGRQEETKDEDDNEAFVPPPLLRMETPNLPDVTEQVVQLMNGQSLQLTDMYQSILFTKAMKENPSYLENMEEELTDTDDSDDDDDDDF